MCGRYTLTIEEEALQVALGVEGLLHPEPRYNIAPTQNAPVVFREGGECVSRPHRWGLVPSWAKDPGIGNRMINARSETAHEKPSFRSAFRSGRCLIPADGFYEWKAEGGRKIPFWIHLESRELFTFAGLRERWSPPGGPPLETFTILTTASNDFLRPLHDRMPVILPPEVRDLWLDPAADRDELRRILLPFPEDSMAAREVSMRVNSPRNDDPGCLESPVTGTT
jgi:putative SOS response-associated peptidase YedK